MKYVIGFIIAYMIFSRNNLSNTTIPINPQNIGENEHNSQ